jgi:hypothetical protein
MSDSDYEARELVRRAIREAVQRDGGEMILRSGPAGTTLEPEALAGIAAAAAIGHESRRLIGRYARQAREDGRTWADIARALGRDSDPAAVYRLLAVDLGSGLVFTWTCPACGGNVSDRGPEYSPEYAEEGHMEDCARFTTAVEAHNAQWEDPETREQ